MPIGREAPCGPRDRYRVRLRAWRVGVWGRGSLNCRACGTDRICWGTGQPRGQCENGCLPLLSKEPWSGLCGGQELRFVRQNSRRPVLGLWCLLARRLIPRISCPVWPVPQPPCSTPSCALTDMGCYDTESEWTGGQPGVVRFTKIFSPRSVAKTLQPSFSAVLPYNLVAYL